MGSKLIALVGFILAMVLLISSEVAAARELPHTSNTADAPQATRRPITYRNPLNPNYPPCNPKIYRSCIGRRPKSRRHRSCLYGNCNRGGGPQPPSPDPK